MKPAHACKQVEYACVIHTLLGTPNARAPRLLIRVDHSLSYDFLSKKSSATHPPTYSEVSAPVARWCRTVVGRPPATEAHHKTTEPPTRGNPQTALLLSESAVTMGIKPVKYVAATLRNVAGCPLPGLK